ncbi:hypothetical protein J6590_017924 [Homalodisca vitripennis]|nr:hypothetical protein J6590_017924 [Homalodisca vitripennis]
MQRSAARLQTAGCTTAIQERPHSGSAVQGNIPIMGYRYFISTLKVALNILCKEVQPEYRLPDAKPQYRRGLTLALLYRVVLSLCPNSVRPQFRSGGMDITRPLSSGKQEFDTDSSRPPLYQPFPKLESLIQCSGEAEYVYDIPTIGCELYAAFVITKHGPATLQGLDPSKALMLPGVVAFFSAKDIPGENTFTPRPQFFFPDNELMLPGVVAFFSAKDIPGENTFTPRPQFFFPDNELVFADKEILFAGQQVGIIVAKTQELADLAAELVLIHCKDKKRPVLDVREAVKNQDTSRIFLSFTKPPIPTPAVYKIVKGDFKMESQYHFMMETLTCVTYPAEDGGLDIYCATQWQQQVQETVALLCNIQEAR